MLNPEIITVVAGGAIYTGWERVQVSAGIDQAARDFTLETTERIGEWKFPPGTPVQIYANDDLLVDGYVNAYEASGDANSHRIAIRGRGKGQDIIDSSAEHPTGYFENETPGEALRKLDKFGVGIVDRVPLKRVPYMQLKQGETVFQFGERYLRDQAATLMGMPDGSIEITNASVAKPHFGILMEGRNIKSFQVSLTDNGRHSRYIVKGQNRLGTGSASLRIRQEVQDSGVKRERPKIIAAETDTDDARAKERAQHEKERAAGRSITAAVQTQGFRDFAGELFAPNRLIYVHAPILMHLSMAMLIERAEFSQDQSGSLTQLTLVDPRAYRGRKQSGMTPLSESAQEAERWGAEGAVRQELESGDAITDPAWTEGF